MLCATGAGVGQRQYELNARYTYTLFKIDQNCTRGDLRPVQAKRDSNIVSVRPHRAPIPTLRPILPATTLKRK
jgi:hypothetical protein